MYMVLAYITAQ